MNDSSLPKVALAGLPAELARWLEKRLPGIAAIAVSTGTEALAEVQRGAAVLVIDHDTPDPPARQTVAKLSAGGHPLPVIYCLSETVGRDLPGQLVNELGVAQILFHPLSPEEVAVQVARALGRGLEGQGAPKAPLAEGTDEAASARLQAGLAQIWERLGALAFERMNVLERALKAINSGQLDPEGRRQAERAAHKLTGSLGTFGFAAGTRFAREIEQLLRSGTQWDEVRTMRFSELLSALSLELASAPQVNRPDASQRPADLLLVTHDPELAERLSDEAAARQFELAAVAEVGTALQSVAAARPRLVLLDVELGAAEEALDFVARVSGWSPPVPVVALTAEGTLADRVEVVRHGGRAFLRKWSSASSILDVALGILERTEAPRARVLAVDDDPQVLAALRALLVPQDLGLTTLDDPLRFWDVLTQASPDLLLLDVDMPGLSGVELCRVARSDPRWAHLPILFLTAHADSATVHRVFAAGADDFIAKPIVGPELTTRILNRLERTRLLRSAAESDALTGVANRRRGSAAIADFVDLARRHAQPLALAVLHLDHLQRANERHGYAAGDEVLAKLGQLMKRRFRSEDVVARWGGDEFVVAMYGMSRADGVERLSMLLEDLREEKFCGRDGEFQATFSAGVAEYPQDGNGLDRLYEVAEEARRRAEAAGGDRVLTTRWSGADEERAALDVALALGDEAQGALLVHALETRGYSVRWFRDGRTAAGLLAGERPLVEARVIVLDSELGGIDGFDLLARLKTGGRADRTPVLMVTSPAVDNQAAMALRLGAFGHVAKPFGLPVLMSLIRRALAESALAPPPVGEGPSRPAARPV